MSNKLATLAVALCLPLAACANDKLKEEELYQAAKSMAVAMNELGAKIKECEKDRPVLPKSVFKDINLTSNEALTALIYFEQINEIECLKEADTKFIITNLVWSDALKNSSDAPLEGFDKEKVEIMQDIAISAYKSMNKLKVRYAKISAEKREKLEQLKELKSRFNASKTFEVIEAKSK
ncbi:hypothetical protein [Zooshikella harenae]|uniref:Lipoprotein n=1 Tax=Zooshikella harenae TaxID=2827238 RepID=A0ABS5ZIZ9_9GAMM|nr:hypothetical protein [Zooshikella harenae]MBU2714002.1 hypothetical protein [Zooshikella harenae]